MLGPSDRSRRAVFAQSSRGSAVVVDEAVDKKAKRRVELLQAARTVFASKGYHDAKIEDIVAEAKVAKGTFYLYFRDKRSIFVELVDAFFLRIEGAILTVETSVDIESQVKHNLRALVAVLLDDPLLAQILLSYAAGLDPAFVAKIRAFYESVRDMLTESLVVGQGLGIVAPGDAQLYATCTIGALKEVLLEHASAQRARPREEIVTGLFGLLETGYLRVKPRAAVDGVGA